MRLLASILPPIPAWPDAGAKDGALFFVAARELRDGFVKLGYSPIMAYGLIAQAEAESSLDPNALGDHEGPNKIPSAFGLFQRHAQRCAAIRQALGFDIVSLVIAGKNTIANEIKATDWELKTFPYLGLAALMAATSSSEAGQIGCTQFERAGAAGAASKRGRMATRWENFFAPTLKTKVWMAIENGVLS